MIGGLFYGLFGVNRWLQKVQSVCAIWGMKSQGVFSKWLTWFHCPLSLPNVKAWFQSVSGSSVQLSELGGFRRVELGESVEGCPIKKQQPRWTQVRGRTVRRRGWARLAKREPLTS